MKTECWRINGQIQSWVETFANINNTSATWIMNGRRLNQLWWAFSVESITALTDSTCDCGPLTVYWLGTKTQLPVWAPVWTLLEEMNWQSQPEINSWYFTVAIITVKRPLGLRSGDTNNVMAASQWDADLGQVTVQLARCLVSVVESTEKLSSSTTETSIGFGFWAGFQGAAGSHSPVSRSCRGNPLRAFRVSLWRKCLSRDKLAGSQWLRLWIGDMSN